MTFRARKALILAALCLLLTGGALDARGNGQYLAEQAAEQYGDCVEPVMLGVVPSPSLLSYCRKVPSSRLVMVRSQAMMLLAVFLVIFLRTKDIKAYFN